MSHWEKPEREQLLTLFQHRTQSHQERVLIAMLKQEEEEEIPLGQQRIQGRILAEGGWECIKSTWVEGKIAQTSGKQSSTGDK